MPGRGTTYRIKAGDFAGATGTLTQIDDSRAVLRRALDGSEIPVAMDELEVVRVGRLKEREAPVKQKRYLVYCIDLRSGKLAKAATFAATHNALLEAINRWNEASGAYWKYWTLFEDADAMEGGSCQS